MTKRILGAFYVGVIALLALQSVSAQSEREIATAAAGDKYVISARAGGVNYVEGSVTIARKDGKSGYLLKRDEIAVGDRVSTGPNSRAEILLNPGSFMRIGPNASFEFKSTSLDDLNVRLDSGSAIFEVFASREFKIRVVTPNAKMLLIESGVFRVDATPDGGANVEVWEGKALLGDHNSTLLTKGLAATLKDGVSTVKKFDRGDRDEFEAWSKSRGKDLAKQSAKLKNQDVRNSLINSFNGGGWGMYRSFGLWVFNSMYGGYSFLPFGYGWYSPYGYGYGNSIFNYNLPPTVFLPPVGGSRVIGGNSGSNGGNNGGSNGGTVTRVMSQGDRSPTPPFVRMQNAAGAGSSPVFGGGRSIQDSGTPMNRSGPASSPTVYAAPAPAPAPASAPAAPTAKPSRKGGDR